MKRFIEYAVIHIVMPSLAVNVVAISLVAAVVLASLLGGPDTRYQGTYPDTVRALAGIALIVGPAKLAAAIGRTFLRSGGLPAYRASYVAALAGSGVGIAMLLSLAFPVSLASALVPYALAAACAGALWVRYYAFAV
jgi:hypothetical protein